MAMKFKLSFAENYTVIDGIHALHLICETDEPASERILYSFDVDLYSTGKRYEKHWSKVQMPKGARKVEIPFVPPMEWANDFTQNIGDLMHEDACGLFQASMTVHYTGYAGTVTFTHDYTGFAAQLSSGVKAEWMPTVGAVSVEAADGVVPSDWGVWVQGKSVVRLIADKAAGVMGSKILNWQFGHGLEQTEPRAEIPLVQSGQISIPVTVTDSRLRRVTTDILLDVKPYQPPSLTNIDSQRCNLDGTLEEEGTCFLPMFQLKYSGVDGRNLVSVTCRWKKVTDTEYGAPHEPERGVPLEAYLEPGTSYDVKYTVSDAFSCIDYFDYISSTVYLLHFLKGGTGIAVGKQAEKENLFDVGLDSTFRRNVNVGGALSVMGRLDLSGTDVTDTMRSLGKTQVEKMRCKANFTEVTVNAAAKWGNLVVTHLIGVLSNYGNPVYENQEYHVADLPHGFFSPTGVTVVFAAQNGSPCTGYVTPQGNLYLVTNQAFLQNTEICTVGIL